MKTKILTTFAVLALTAGTASASQASTKQAYNAEALNTLVGVVKKAEQTAFYVARRGGDSEPYTG